MIAPATDGPVPVTCPQCGHGQELQPTVVLRPGDPALAQLFGGTLNRLTCGACGTAFRVDVPLLYRDDEHRFVVYLLPDSAGEEAEATAERIVAGVFAGVARSARPEWRLVGTYAELVEKIGLCRNGLDDRLVEFIKYQMYLRRERDLDPRQRTLLYDFSNPSAGNLCFIVYDRRTSRPDGAAHIPMDTYRELAATLAKDAGLRDELRRLFPGHRVSAAAAFTD